MEDPIYIHISDVKAYEPSVMWENRLYAIGGGTDVVAGEEVRTHEEEERVAVFKLPDSDGYDMYHSGLSVADPGIFSIGCRELGNSSIVRYLSFNLENKEASWVKVKSEGGFGNSDYPIQVFDGRLFCIGDLMSGFGRGGRLIRFRTPRHDLDADLDPQVFLMKPPEELHLVQPYSFEEYPPLVYPFVVGLTQETKVGVTQEQEQDQGRRLWIFWASATHQPCYGGLGYYDLGNNIEPTSWRWHMVNAHFSWPSNSRNPVLVRDKYMILYANHTPITSDCEEENEIRGCYVYDMSTHKWFVEPIQGLPSPKIECKGQVMEFGSQTMAFVFSNPKPGQCYQIEWVKFTLIINEETDPPTFRAQTLSSGSFSSQSGAITIIPPSLSLSSHQSLKRRRLEGQFGEEQSSAVEEGGVQVSL